MFTKNSEGARVHSDGWSVKFKGSDTCLYREDGSEVEFKFMLVKKAFVFSIVSNGGGVEGDLRQRAVDRLKDYLNWDGGWNPFRIEI